MIFGRKDKSLHMSAPRARTLYGVRVYKLPVGKYIQVLRTMEELPSLLLNKVFPDMEVSEVFKHLQTLDKDGLLALVGRLLTVVPEEACGILSELLGIAENRLLDPDAPDALSLSELTEILLAFWEVNDMTDFFGNVRRLMGTAAAQTIGSSVGLQSPKA